jgi:uncharacterized protein YlaI
MWFPLLTRSKAKEHCTVCNKELIKFRYKPRNEWDIQGMLCGDCHVIKSMEHSGRTEGSGSKNQHQTVEDEKEVSLKCGMCDADIDSGSEHLKAKWQWNMDTHLILCRRCYSIKSKEYEKRINYCAVCGNKMSFFRYNPKPKWKIDGQLCRLCWDNSNIHWKNQG